MLPVFGETIGRTVDLLGLDQACQGYRGDWFRRRPSLDCLVELADPATQENATQAIDHEVMVDGAENKCSGASRRSDQEKVLPLSRFGSRLSSCCIHAMAAANGSGSADLSIIFSPAPGSGPMTW